VKIEDCLYYLSENASSGQLSHLSVGELLYILSQTNAFDIVGYEVNLFLTVYKIVKVDNSWMVQFFQACDFSLAGFFLHGVLEFELVVDLDGVLLLIPLVEAKADLCVCALPDAFTDLVMI
jgi:hypothetical protein